MAFVESVTRLINNENDSFVPAYSTVHNNESALKSESFILVKSSFLLSLSRLQCSIQRCSVSASLLADGCSSLGCQVCLGPPVPLARLRSLTLYSDSGRAQIIYLLVLSVQCLRSSSVLWLSSIGPDWVQVVLFCLSL